MTDDKLTSLSRVEPPAPRQEARDRARQAALLAFDEAAAEQADTAAAEIKRHATQGSGAIARLIQRLWIEPTEWMMEKQSRMAALALVALLVPGAGYVGFKIARDNPARIEQTGGGGLSTLNTIRREDQSQAATEPGTPRSTARQFDGGPLSMSDVATKKAPSRRIASVPAPHSFSTGGQPSAAGRARLTKQSSKAMIAPVDRPSRPVATQNRDQFAAKPTNPIKRVTSDPVSTFSVDVDTASYAFVRRALKAGRLPRPAAVRVEEMINYFKYDYPKPTSIDTPFTTTISLDTTAWNKNTKLLQIGIKGFDIDRTQARPANLVFLIDVSGSMRSPDRIGLLKSSFRLLVERLQPSDTVSIVTYAGRAGTVLKPTKVANKKAILSALDQLTAGGSTAGAAGIEQAYALAESAFRKDGVNRVILATDGDFNVGISDRATLKRYIEKKRESGVFLSVLGFGRGNYNDALMQTLAQNGNGTAAYIDTLKEAQKVLVEEATSSLFPIAKDVKVQVEFNPRTVAEYRLIGYETRALRREDFNNDRVDAGDIGSGHTVTAIYEITPVGSPAISSDPLRYADNTAKRRAVSAGSDDEYAFVKLRYKRPDEDKSRLVTVPVPVVQKPVASSEARFASAVAAFGQKLRGEKALESLSYDAIIDQALQARGLDPYGYRAEFIQLVRLAKALPKGPQVDPRPRQSRPAPMPRPRQ